MSQSLRRFSLAAALLFVATACGDESTKEVTSPTDVANVLARPHSSEEIDSITGSPYAIGNSGSEIRASGVADNEGFEMVKGATASAGDPGLTFEDLNHSGSSYHSMSAHNPYQGVTFSVDLYHWNYPNYGQAHSGTVFLFNAGGAANQSITYPAPTMFKGVWASEPHGDASQLIMTGYNGAIPVGTATSPPLIATTQYVPSNFAGPVTKVVFNTHRGNYDWYVIDDINADGPGAPPPPPPPSDNSPPVITPNVTGPMGSNDWYTGDVNITWSVVDNESAVTSPPCPAITVVNNTAGITFTCNATSAGGSSSRSVTIKRDNTPPVITETLTGTLGNNGYYVSNVNVTWSITDDVSLVPSPNCPTPPVDFDTNGITRSCTSTNFAGLNTTKVITIKRDATPPQISPNLTGINGGPPGNWFRTDVGVAWIFSDMTSGIETTAGCGASSVTTDTPVQLTFTCTVTDRAGNSFFRNAIVKRDASFPEIQKIVTGTLGLDDWFTSDVSIGFNVIPQGPSGIVSPPCPVFLLTTDTPGTPFPCTAKTGAGVVVTKTANIKRDATVPTVTPTVGGTLGTGGWYTSDVNIGWAVLGSGPSGATSGCAVETLSTDSPGTAYSCLATSGAGLTATGNVEVKRDASVPVVTPNVSGDLGLNGWYTSNVSVSWSAVASGPSGATASGCGAASITTDTSGDTFTCSATSGAGLSSGGEVTIKRDASTPTITPTVSGTLGANGWYTSDVSVSWAVTANGPSSVSASGCAVSTLDSDSNGMTYNCSATTAAGNTANGSVTAKRDATNPLIAYSGNAGTYSANQNVSISCSASDAMSGLALNTCANISGPAYSFGAGSESFSANAKDNAGNTSSAAGSFTVSATAASICALVQQFVTGPGAQGVGGSMCTKLENGSIQAFINQVQAQSGKKISVENANILIALAGGL